MAPRKGIRGLAIPRNRIFARLAADRHIGNSKVQSDDGNNNDLGSQTPEVEGGSDVDMADTPSLLGGKPDSYWLIKWQSLDLESAVASQLEFFKTEPDFNNSNRSYILFFNAIRNTILKSKAAAKSIKKDARARSNLKLLILQFENLANRSRCLLRDELEHMKMDDYGRYRTFAEFENVLDHHASFLQLTGKVACILDLEEEWTSTSRLVARAKDSLGLLKQKSLENYISSMQNVQPAKSPVNTAGPLSAEMLKMDCDFTEAVWCQWVEGCIAYFEYWTADSSQEVPAKNFVRHLSQFRLAMELFLRHNSIPEGRRSTLLALAKKYMRQYSDYAARELEKQYTKLRDDVKRSGIYETEAAFGHLADEIEVFANEAPHDIELEIWNEAVPAILSKEKVLVAKNALNLLYKDFQIKRYSEDEIAYLWLLTWRNIKHMLPYWTSPDLGAVWPEDLRPPVVIQPRNLALPFVEKNISQLLEIVRKDNDALYQKEIEGLVGDYCAYIDRYVKGKAEGVDLLYREYSTIWYNKKRLPFAQLVGLEESLLKKVVMPTNISQMISHRVIVRMNHIMEGPRPFKRWEVTDTGAIKTYSPTSTWVEEQRALTQQADFQYDHAERGHSSDSSYDPSQRPAAGTGAGGDDNGDGDGKRNPRLGDDEESSGSEEEVEVISPGGTKRVERRKKGKRVTSEVTAEIPTKAEQLVKLRGSSNSDSMGSHSSFQGGRGEDRQIGEVLSGLHPVPADSIVHHRRRLNALSVQEPSAVPNAQYPLPETAAPQRAAALQIVRELADPGIFTEGPRPEDVQNYVNPALRLPLNELDNRPNQPGQGPEPHVVRRALSRLRSVLGSPFFGRSPTRSQPRATPRIPESNAQRARRERQAQDLTPSALRRQADRYAVTKSPVVGARRSRRVPGTSSSVDQSATDSDLPWSDKENQSPVGSLSANDSNQENESPEKDSNQENQKPTHTTQQAQANADDWNSPSPPHEYDNRIYHGSPFRTPGTPTPVRRGNSLQSSGSRQPGLPPPGTHAGPSEQGDQNINASPPAPPEDDGNRPELGRLSRWIHMELASNNRDMHAAYQIYRELFRTQRPNTGTYLFELLRGHTEMVTFGNYIFERNITFGLEARPQLPQGVPATIRPPSTPRGQIDNFSEWWWNDPFEGTRQGQRRPAAAWNETPHEAEMTRTSHHPSNPSGIAAPGHPFGEARYDLTASLPASSDRTWSWSANSQTGLPQRDFNIFIDSENRLTTSSQDLGESIGTVVPNGHGQINVRVPPGWSIDIGPARGDRSAAPSPETGLNGSDSSSGSTVHPQGGQEVTFTSPGFVIHQDSPSGSGSARNAQNRFRPPPTLGLVDPPAQQQGGKSDEIAETSDPATSSLSSYPKTSSRSSKQGKSKSDRSSSSSSSGSKGRPANGDNPSTTSSSSSDNQPAATSAPSPTNPPPTTPAPTATKQTQTPWYLSWSTSTVTRLRTELRQRGIVLNDSSLRLKQQMIDRLRRDDAENGVGGEWWPDDHVQDGGEAEEEGDAEDGEERKKEVKKGKGKGKRRRTDPFEESEGDGDNEGEGEEGQGKGKRRKMAKGNGKGTRRTI